MDSTLSWQDLYVLNEIGRPAGFLKMICEVWGVRVDSIVEIGVFAGRTSKELRVLFPGATLYLIDPWELYEEYLSPEAGPMSKDVGAYEKAYQRVCGEFKGDSKAHILRKTSMQAVGDVPDGVDLVFIDGNHDYQHVHQDIGHWLPKVRPGGILSGHDYSVCSGVRRAVDAFFPEGIVTGLDDTWLVQV